MNGTVKCRGKCQWKNYDQSCKCQVYLTSKTSDCEGCGHDSFLHEILLLQLEDNLDDQYIKDKQALKRYFKFDSFRPMQYDIFHAVYHERVDAFIVMATGGGKSICFQLPAILDKGVSIVVC